MCTDCAARAKMMRDDLLNARMAQALGHAVKGVAEMAGLKEKTGAAELEAKENGPVIRGPGGRLGKGNRR